MPELLFDPGVVIPPQPTVASMVWKSQVLTLWDLCQNQIPWDTGSSLPNISLDMSKHRLEWNQHEMSSCLHSRRSSWWGHNPSPQRAEQLWDQHSSTSLRLSSAPPALSAPSLPFTAVFVFLPQLVFSVIHVSVHHISRLCVRRKERSPPTQQPCNGWTFPIRSELTACENNSLNY